MSPGAGYPHSPLRTCLLFAQTSQDSRAASQPGPLTRGAVHVRRLRRSIHDRFSRYFLVGSSMSGINYHSHTDAYNGLVHGRKRW